MAIEGNTAAYSLEAIVYVTCSSYYYTAISFTGQNSGAHKYKRIGRSIGWCFLCSFVVSTVCGWGVYLFGEPLLKIYNPDPEVIRWGMIRLKILLTVYCLTDIVKKTCAPCKFHINTELSSHKTCNIRNFK